MIEQGRNRLGEGPPVLGHGASILRGGGDERPRGPPTFQTGVGGGKGHCLAIRGQEVYSGCGPAAVNFLGAPGETPSLNVRPHSFSLTTKTGGGGGRKGDIIFQELLKTPAGKERNSPDTRAQLQQNS